MIEINAEMEMVLFDLGNLWYVFITLVALSFIKRLYLFYMVDKRSSWMLRGLIKHHKREYPHLSERQILSHIRKGLGDERTFLERFLAS